MLFESECENLEIGKVSGGGVRLGGMGRGGMGRGGVGVVKLWKTFHDIPSILYFSLKKLSNC